MRASVRNEAAVSYYNQLRNIEELPPGFVEWTLSIIEGRAADLVARLVDGGTLSAEEILDMALFIYVQHYRTPRGRQWTMYGFEQGHKLDVMRRMLDAKQMQKFYRSQGEKISLGEARERGRRLAHELDTGKVVLKVQHDHAVAGMFMFVEAVVPGMASEMSWTIVHTEPKDRFVLSDHPVLIHDPTSGPRSGASWLSSPEVRVSMPIDPTTCLVLRPGPPRLEHSHGHSDYVLDLNLGTYASAEWAIYGPRVDLVQKVRAEAKRRKVRVAALTPVPPKIHILETTTEEDDRGVTIKTLAPQGRVRRRQSWPNWDN